jgi:hypothetical protein
MRINAKVVAALAAAGLAIYLAVPNLFYAALPLLILAACPLSMFLMMRMMSGGKKDESLGASQPAPPVDTRQRLLTDDTDVLPPATGKGR